MINQMGIYVIQVLRSVEVPNDAQIDKRIFEMSEKKCATVSLQASEVALKNEYHGSSVSNLHQGILVTTMKTDGLVYVLKRDINTEYYEIVSGTNPPGAARPVISRHIFERRSGRCVECVEHVNSPSVDVEVV